MILTVPQDRELYPTLGPAICDYIEEWLIFGPGDLRGQPAVVDEEARALIYRIYEVYPKGHALAGRRRFPRAGISLAKGLRKTELAGWFSACELSPDAPVRCVDWKWDKTARVWLPIGGPVTDPYIPMVAFCGSTDVQVTVRRTITVCHCLKCKAVWHLLSDAEPTQA